MNTAGKRFIFTSQGYLIRIATQISSWPIVCCLHHVMPYTMFKTMCAFVDWSSDVIDRV